MKARQIYITAHDHKRLDELLATESNFDYRDRNDLKSLQAELKRAKIVSSKEVPHNVVTMNTRLIFRDLDDDSRTEVTLVFPAQSHIEDGKLSVLSPIGTGLLGYSEGDTIEWAVPDGLRRVCIEKILYQPEAAGDLHL